MSTYKANQCDNLRSWLKVILRFISFPVHSLLSSHLGPPIKDMQRLLLAFLSEYVTKDGIKIHVT